MTPEKLTDEQIVQKLKDYEVVCDECACNDGDMNGKQLMLKAVDLINRIKAKNLQLNSDLIILENDYEYLKQNFDETVEKNKRLRMKVINAVNTIADLKRLLKRNGG